MFQVPELIVHCVDSHAGLLVQSQQREFPTSNANLDVLSSAKNAPRLLLLVLLRGIGGLLFGLWVDGFHLGRVSSGQVVAQNNCLLEDLPTDMTPANKVRGHVQKTKDVCLIFG